MLTETQYLLICLMEECDEVSQRAAKALRFGLDENQVGEPNNRQRLLQELDDLYTVVSELRTRKVISQPGPKLDKVHKIIKYMEYSREQGVLEAA